MHVSPSVGHGLSVDGSASLSPHDSTVQAYGGHKYRVLSGTVPPSSSLSVTAHHVHEATTSHFAAAAVVADPEVEDDDFEEYSTGKASGALVGRVGTAHKDAAVVTKDEATTRKDEATAHKDAADARTDVTVVHKVVTVARTAGLEKDAVATILEGQEVVSGVNIGHITMAEFKKAMVRRGVTVKDEKTLARVVADLPKGATRTEGMREALKKFLGKTHSDADIHALAETTAQREVHSARFPSPI